MEETSNRNTDINRSENADDGAALGEEGREVRLGSDGGET